jgi:NAD(P)-dependent dehydrogenase (short-subunit alcohol dehydrogenase family)
MSVSFENRVAIVTGAGGGLGRAYALELARRGAKVVVNDIGGARDGSGSSDAARKVVEEIEAEGGTAIVNGASVTEFDQVEEMVARARRDWGGVHILINNAGILRDKSFAKMTMDDFRLVVEVHLIGSANCTKAVWETMREQAYGRILMTSSSTGLFGNFGQANYGAAKLGLAGFAKTLHLEGAKYNIRVNSLAPTAATRMTEDIFPPEMMAGLQPRQCGSGGALPRLRRGAQQHDRRRRRGRRAGVLRDADAGLRPSGRPPDSRGSGRELAQDRRSHRRNRAAVRRGTGYADPGDAQAAIGVLYN